MEKEPSSGHEFGAESYKDDKDKRTDKKDKKQEAKKLGALTSISFEKSGTNAKDKEVKQTPASERTEPKGLDALFSKKDQPAAEAEPEIAATEHEESGETDEPAMEASHETIDEVKRLALIEELDESIANLEAEVEATAADTPEHIEAVTALEVEAKLRAKAENPDIETDEETTREFDRRLAEIEVTLPEAEEVETIPELQHPLRRPAENIAPITEATEEPQAPTTPAPSSSSKIPVTQSPTVSTPPPFPTRTATAPLPPLPRSAIPGAPANPELVPPPTKAAEKTKTYPQTETTTTTKERSSRARAAVGAGVLGYMIGRRGGRKRAEAKLQPRIDELEQAAEKTKRNVRTHEQQLRSAVRELVSPPSAPERAVPPVDRPAPKKDMDLPVLPTPELPTSSTKQPEEVAAPTLKTPETTSSQPSFEATPLPLQTVEATTDVVDIFDRRQEKPEEKNKQAQITNHEIRQVEQLSTPEILHRADMLYISGMSVKDLYNADRIDRQGLITIVQESMRGHDIKAAFEKVELGAERQRERAREFRHDDTALAAASTTPATSSVPPIAKPLGHTIVQDIKVHSTHTPLNLPNTPDSDKLEPLATTSAKTNEVEHQPSDAQHRRPAEFKFAAIAAIAIAALIIWAILG